MFIDQARVAVSAGSGGNGCNSIFRSKVAWKGKPNGGPGGNGGNVVLKASRCIQTLLDFHYNRHFKADRGHHGGSNHKTGRSAEDFTILVPCGTVIKDAETGFVLRDLVRHDDTVIIAKGGKGGKGNSRWREATPGEPGEEKELLFELKLIADVGIIGYPNAGKSTFISKVSSAKSKIADYPFTTKQPILGIVRHFDETLTFADMPGLIEGAHQGRGLGHRFLKHIERTRILLHMVDISMMERADPYEDLLTIQKELELYDKSLMNKKRIIVLSKIDMPGAKDSADKIKKKIKEKVFPVSALTGEGINPLLDHIFKIVHNEGCDETYSS
jgi:GTPase